VLGSLQCAALTTCAVLAHKQATLCWQQLPATWSLRGSPAHLV
jgi:hypothetical protein